MSTKKENKQAASINKFHLSNFLLDNVVGSGSDIRVWLKILQKSDATGLYRFSIDDLAKQLGIAYATARLSVERLVEAGIIKRLSVGSVASYQLTSAKELSQCWSVDEFTQVAKDIVDEMIEKAEASGNTEFRFLVHRSFHEPKSCEECRKVYRTELETHLGVTVTEDELDQWIDAGAFVHAFGAGRCDVHLGMIRGEYAAVLAEMAKSGNTKQWMTANWFSNLAKANVMGLVGLDEVRVSKVKSIDLAELVQSPHVKRRLKNGEKSFPNGG